MEEIAINSPILDGAVLGGYLFGQVMPLDSKLEKRIDTLYRNTRQMPLVAILGVFVPILLLVVAPLGLLYWFWRRDLLRIADSGGLAMDPVPPPLLSARPSGELSTAGKLDYVRSRRHALLIPTFILAGFIVMLVGLILLVVILSPPQQ